MLKRRCGAKHPAEKYIPRKHESSLAEPPPIRLTKLEMEEMARDFRNDLKLDDGKPLDPLKIVIEGIKVLTIRQIPGLDPKIITHLEGPNSSTWSAMSVPVDEDKDKWAIVRNEQHQVVRQRVSLLEEFWHILLGHKLTKIAKIADAYGRTFEEEEEHDAFYLAAATLLPERVIKNAVRGKKDIVQLAEVYGTSPELVEYRIKRLGLWREYKGKSVRLE
jgi:Zn-dependent peptidase ImmA (M78 family)